MKELRSVAFQTNEKKAAENAISNSSSQTVRVSVSQAHKYI